jgi:sodium/bile acid cotransporter 7
MAKVLFAGHPIGSIVLPLMLFHQIQLMTCAVLAQRYRKQQLAAQAGISRPSGQSPVSITLAGLFA